MIKPIIKIVVILALGMAVSWGSIYLKSNYIANFMTESLVNALITLLAINIAILSVIMTKIGEIAVKKNASFSRTIRSMRGSVYEQVVLLSLAVLILAMTASPIVLGLWVQLPLILNGLLVSILVYAITILLDTAGSIFILMEYEDVEHKDMSNQR